MAVTDLDMLSPREALILTFLARGKTNGEIAREIFISEKTVKGHVAAIFRTVGATNRTEAAYMYWKLLCTCGAIE